MTDSTAGEYSHSGKLGTSIFIVPIGGFIVSVVLSIVYAYVDVYSPIAGYISLLFVVCLAFGLGWSISKLGYLARCRNPGFLHLVGLACGLVALYTSFAAFEYALFDRYEEDFSATLLDVLFSPGAVWGIAKEINAVGWYTIFGYTPAGIVLWLLWGAEAIIIVGGSSLFATAAINEEVFCETCDQWCSRTPGALHLGFPEEESALEDLRPDNLIPLAALESVDSSAPIYLRVDMWKCNSCDTAALQTKTCAMVPDDDGKLELKTDDLTQIWSTTSAVLDEISKPRQ